MPTPADTTKTIIHSKGYTVTTATVTTPPTPKDGFDLMAILTLVIPVLTFIAGYFLNLYFENRKERKRLKDVKEYFLALAEFLPIVVNRQRSSIINTVFKLESMTDANIHIRVDPNLSTEKIRSVSDLDLYKIFIANKGRVKKTTELLNGLTTVLNYIDANGSQLKEINTALSKKIHVYSEINNNLFDELAHEDQTLRLQGKFENTSRDEESYKLHVEYTQCIFEADEKMRKENIARSNLAKRYEYYILPLFEITNVIESNQSTYTRLQNIRKLKDEYDSFLLSINILIGTLNNYAESYEATSNTMREICSDL